MKRKTNWMKHWQAKNDRGMKLLDCSTRREVIGWKECEKNVIERKAFDSNWFNWLNMPVPFRKTMNIAVLSRRLRSWSQGPICFEWTDLVMKLQSYEKLNKIKTTNFITASQLSRIIYYQPTRPIVNIFRNPLFLLKKYCFGAPFHSHLRSTWDPFEIHLRSTWNPLEIHLESTWDPLQIHFRSTWDPVWFWSSCRNSWKIHFRSTF